MDANATGVPFNPALATDRKVFIRKRNGDLAGGNFTIPKGDFAHFLGYRKASSAEQSGETPVTADRVLELAMRQQFQKLGERSMQRGMAYRNMYVSAGRYENQPGREKDMIQDGLDSIRQSVEVNQQSNIYYLEMQYKFQWASKSFGVISNLMKVRNESTKKAINEVR